MHGAWGEIGRLAVWLVVASGLAWLAFEVIVDRDAEDGGRLR